MRIGIDGRAVGKNVGLGIYTSNLLRGLVRLKKKVEYVVYLTRGGVRGLDSCLSKRIAWGSLESHMVGDFWEQVVLPVELRNRSIDVYHGTNARLPISRSTAKYVLTIHDLVPVLFPDLNTRAYSFYMAKAMRISAKMADLIIAVSNSTKKDAVERLGIPHEKIRVVYEGVSERFRVLDKMSCLDHLKKKYEIGKGFILFIGRLEPRKNILRLLKGLRLLLSQERFDGQLVLLGERTPAHQAIVDCIGRYHLRQRTVFIHGAEESELPLIYNGASAFVLPSLYEGFGLPLLEAMACGIPVVASNISSIPEIAGDAAILVNPLDPQAIADGLKTALFDSSRIRELVANGLRRASCFSWDTAAGQTLKIYQECLNGQRD